MRNIIIIILFPLLSLSQERDTRFAFMATGVDPGNAIYGSKVNEPAYNGSYSIGFRDRGFQLQATYQVFTAINFKAVEVYAGKVFNYGRRFNYVALAGVSMIQRKVNWLNQELHPALNLQGKIEYHFNNTFFVFGLGEFCYRGDIQELVPSGRIGVAVKLFNR
ncbi:hypothetical protein J0871_16775 [Salegentibacter sp. BDJ18]|uniref:hypothetical protein n=1 Tax=Salegentibacter sp. BDJ18 TaxID=2816376 RepID=UPI001AAFEC9D|nr:hypothetical protein [Salegentibacter sp. BDJ18]MBO2546073.1 hypothetical protein [Salegentibacter sp. BDJ18]